MDNLAACYQAIYKLDLGQLGPNHPSAINAIHNLASAYVVTKQPGKGLPMFVEVVAKKRKRLGENDARFDGMLMVISRNLL